MRIVLLFLLTFQLEAMAVSFCKEEANCSPKITCEPNCTDEEREYYESLDKDDIQSKAEAEEKDSAPVSE